MRKYFKIIALIIVLVITNIFVWSSHTGGEQHLSVSFLDVGQGDSMFIEAPNGKQVLIDGGAGSSVLRELGALMKWHDRSIDIVIGTHPDTDHIGGLVGVLENFRVGTYIDPGVEADNSASDEIDLMLSEKRIDHDVLGRGSRIVLDDNRGIYMDVLWPLPGLEEPDRNDMSIVLRLVYDETEFLLTGDISLHIERQLTWFPEDIHSDVLKLGHHGSKTSSSKLFLETVNPEIAIISAGRGNRYGHPHNEVLENLEELGIPYYGTFTEGSMTIGSDGKSFWQID